MSEYNDKELVQKCKSGNHSAFEKLIVRYQVFVLNVIYRIVGNCADVEDLAQETFVKAFSSIEQYDTERPFSRWIISIATNLSIDYLRRKKPPMISLDQPLHCSDNHVYFQIPDQRENPEEVYARKELATLLETALQRLPVNLRAAIILRA